MIKFINSLQIYIPTAWRGIKIPHGVHISISYAYINVNCIQTAESLNLNCLELPYSDLRGSRHLRESDEKYYKVAES